MWLKIQLYSNKETQGAITSTIIIKEVVMNGNWNLLLIIYLCNLLMLQFY